MIPSSKAVRAARLPRLLAIEALCGVLFAAALVSAPPASAEDVTIWSADLDVKALNVDQDEFGCSESGPFNGQCANSNVLSDDDFKLHGTTYTIRRIEDDGSKLELTLDKLLPENALEILTLNVDDDTELDFDDANVSSSNKRYRWSNSSPSWSSGDDVDLKITDASGPSLVRNTSLGDNDRGTFPKTAIEVRKPLRPGPGRGSHQSESGSEMKSMTTWRSHCTRAGEAIPATD